MAGYVINFRQDTTGKHFINVKNGTGATTTVAVDTAAIARDPEMLRETLNGLGNILKALSMYHYKRDEPCESK